MNTKHAYYCKNQDIETEIKEFIDCYDVQSALILISKACETIANKNNDLDYGLAAEEIEVTAMTPLICELR